jgi:hypothetical protein
MCTSGWIRESKATKHEAEDSFLSSVEEWVELWVNSLHYMKQNKENFTPVAYLVRSRTHPFNSEVRGLQSKEMILYIA